MTNVSTTATSAMEQKIGGYLPTLPSLTGARSLAAFAVFLFHTALLQLFPFQQSGSGKLLKDLFSPQLGALGVAFFFLLSGFIIDWSFREGESSRAFYRRRALKLFPTHAIAALTVVVVLSVPLSNIEAWLPNLLLFNEWTLHWHTTAELNAPSWSLSSEWLFYLLFPLAIPLMRKIRGNSLWWMVGLFTVLLTATHLAIYLFVSPGLTMAPMQPIPVSPDYTWLTRYHMKETLVDSGAATSMWLSYQFPLTRLLEFFVGVTFSRLVKSGIWRNTNLTWPLLSSACCYALTYIAPLTFRFSLLTVLPLSALIATLAVRDIRGLSGWLGNKTTVWLGNISFAFYMAQFPVMAIMQRNFVKGRAVDNFAGYAEWAFLAFVVSIIAAAGMYHLVEKPIMARWARKKPAIAVSPR
ncbi:acyltransferase family protein [Nocardia sp. NPDC051570]|uniref:acyltransferase family protein n=1 Tax=Nocardia sp. NPDC051570 TaxID=3364324 RepID=UPI003794B4B7